MFFEILFRHGLWVSPPAFILGAALLGFSILSLVRIERQSTLARLPLAERSEVELSQAGDVLLCVEMPLFSSRMGQAHFELRGPDGTSVARRANWFRATSSGLTKATITVGRFSIPRPGRYSLQVDMGKPDTAGAQYALLFVKPHLAHSVGFVLLIIVAAFLLIGGIVLFALRLAQKSP